MGVGGRVSVRAAWQAAAEITAAAYGIDPATLLSPTRGRGPRPPREAWEAKKMAVHLAVIVADCDYAALARATGMHRDTVCSHCAEMRDRVLLDDTNEVSAEVLETLTRNRLAGVQRERLDAIRAQMAVLEDSISALLRVSSDAHPTVHPTKSVGPKKIIEDERVIVLARRRA